MQAAQNILAVLTEIYPPRKNQRHGITLDCFGFVMITLMCGTLQHTIQIKDDSLGMDSAKLILDIVKTHNRFVKEKTDIAKQNCPLQQDGCSL